MLTDCERCRERREKIMAAARAMIDWIKTPNKTTGSPMWRAHENDDKRPTHSNSKPARGEASTRSVAKKEKSA